jgi:hypothetical protein
MKRRKVQRRRG